MTIAQTGGAHGDASPDSEMLVAPYAVPPHPANRLYAKAMADVMMKTLGLHLTSIAIGHEFQAAASLVLDYFADSFGLRPEHSATQNIDPEAFFKRLASLKLEDPNPACAVVRNLDWLTTALHLSCAERKLLLWTYVAHSQMPSIIEDVTMTVGFDSEDKAYAALSKLLDEPAAEVAKCFAAPSRLLGMLLIDSHPWRYPLSLDSFFQGTENLTDILEVVHYSPEGMLQRMSELSLYWSWLPDPGVSNERLHEWFEPAMAEACIAVVNRHPLTASHIAELVWWLIGYRMPAEQYETLAGHLDFVIIQKAIQQCCMERSQRDQSITQLAVLQALYAAAQ
jgi:hypothetical protein